MERGPLWRGGHCREVTILERWLLWRGGRCGEVTVSGGNQLSFEIDVKKRKVYFNTQLTMNCPH